MNKEKLRFSILFPFISRVFLVFLFIFTCTTLQVHSATLSEGYNPTGNTMPTISKTDTANSFPFYDKLVSTASVSPIVSITAESTCIPAEQNGYWTSEYDYTANSDVEYYRYYWWKGLSYTVTFEDGSCIVTEGSGIYSNGGNYIYYNGEYYSVIYSDSQSCTTPWLPGNTYVGQITIGNTTTNAEITVTASNASLGYEYIVENNNAYITNCSLTDPVVSIPSVLDGYSVIEIHSLGDAIHLIEELIIPDSVTSIASDLFYDEAALRKISIGTGLQSLSDYQFAYSYNLEQINISTENPSLTSVDGVVYDKAITTMIAFPQAHSGLHIIPDTVTNVDLIFNDLWNYAGSAIQTGAGTPEYITIDQVIYSADTKKVILCSSEKTGSYTMPESVTHIGWFAFARSNLTSITVSPNVSTITDQAFYSCSKLKTINLPKDLKIIEGWAFENCKALEEIVIPAHVTKLGSQVFLRCNSLTSITFLGDAPIIPVENFNHLRLNCYYPASNPTWTSDVMQNYAGYINWIPYDTTAIPKLEGTSFSLSFEDEVLVNFYYTVSDTTDVVEHGMVVFNSYPTIVGQDTADVVYNAPIYDSANDRYMATTRGIAAKEMGDTRYYAVYAKLSNDSYIYSALYDYSPKKYCMNMLSRDTTSDKQKSLCVAMLNYGAAAQNYFNHNTDNLMNKDLTSEQQALVIPYDRNLFSGSSATDSSKLGSFVATATGFSKKSASVSFEGAFSINFYFTPNTPIDSAITFYYWTSDAYNTSETLSTKNASGSIIMDSSDYGCYWAQIEHIAAKDLDNTYYVAAVYYSELELRCTGLIPYSLRRYCMNNDSGTMGSLAQATAMYGYYANMYFTS